jgi:hypothetical protein
MAVHPLPSLLFESVRHGASANLIAELETLSQEITDNDPRRDPSRYGFNALNLQANLPPAPLAQVIPNRENLTRVRARPLGVTCRG